MKSKGEEREKNGCWFNTNNDNFDSAPSDINQTHLTLKIRVAISKLVLLYTVKQKREKGGEMKKMTKKKKDNKKKKQRDIRKCYKLRIVREDLSYPRYPHRPKVTSTRVCTKARPITIISQQKRGRGKNGISFVDMRGVLQTLTDPFCTVMCDYSQ